MIWDKGSGGDNDVVGEGLARGIKGGVSARH